MSFLAPLFLLGGLAVALPVVFHLVRRSSRDRMLFSSLMFLRPTPPRVTRRNRVEHILLLLLRCLVICILALGFARPFLHKPMAAGAQEGVGSRIVLLVDTSASMRRDGVWPAALARARAALESTSAADQVSILTFDDRVRSLINFDEWARMETSDRPDLASQQLAEIKPAWSATRLGNALLAAAEVLEDADRREEHFGPRRIVVVTDLQEGSHLDGLQGYDWARGVEVAIETVQARRPTNAGLQWVIDAEDTTGGADAAARLRVSNSSDAEREQFQVRWAGVAGAPTLDAYVPPGQSRVLSAPKLPDGVVGERVEIEGDDHDFDNVAYVVPPRAEEINVLFLGQDAEKDPAGLLYYLKRAFQDTRRRAVRVEALADAAAVSAAMLNTNRLVVLADPLPSDALAAVGEFLNGGGSVVLVMKEIGAAATLGQLAGAPDLRAAEAMVRDYAMFGRMDFEHPLLAPFSDPRFSDFTKIRFWKHRQLGLESLPGARVIARFDDRDPAIAEIPIGRGRIVVFTSSWQPADSQLALSSKFVPLLYSILEQAGGIRAQLAQYRIGDAVDLSSIAAQSGGVALVVRKPDGSEVPLLAGDARFGQTDQPGIYAVASDPPVRFAVNVDPAESRTAPLPVEDLQRLDLPVKPREIELSKQLEQKQRMHDADLESRQKLWRWLIAGALAVLIAETWLAGWITRRSTTRAEAAA